MATLSRRLWSPKMRALPLVGWSRSSRMRMVVVLPAPLGPRNPKTSPASTEIVTSSMPTTSP